MGIGVIAFWRLLISDNPDHVELWLASVYLLFRFAWGPQNLLQHPRCSAPLVVANAIDVAA